MNHYQCDLLVSNAEYVNLCKRTSYFTNAEQFEQDLLSPQTHVGIIQDNIPHRRVVEHITLGNEEEVRLFIRYPSHIILRPQRTIQLFRLLSANSFSIQEQQSKMAAEQRSKMDIGTKGKLIFNMVDI